MTMAQLTEFLGWCTIINIGLLIFTSLILVASRGWAARIHAKMFGLTEAICSQEYFRYLASCKIAVLMLNLVPYLALKAMAG